MRYSGIIKNDFSAGADVNVTFFVQGCKQRCKNCHNPETWDFNGGKEFGPQTIEELATALRANGVKRNLSIMGGEPLCDENAFLTLLVIEEMQKRFPDIKIYVWTGYLYEDLLKSANPHIKRILESIDTLIDGPYIDEQRDITLPMRGSSNQRIINLKD